MPDVNPVPSQQPTVAVATQKNQINWKNIIIGVVIGAVLFGGGGYLVYNAYQPKSSEPTVTTTTKKATSSAKADETAGWKSVQVKKYDSPDYYSFELKYPPTWQLNKKEDTTYGTTTLTLSKNDYYLEIVQAGSGGVFCFFKGQTLTEEQKTWPSYVFKYDYFEVKTKDLGTLRRARLDDGPPGQSSWPDYAGKPSFRFCQNKQGSWGSPTKVGIISYYVPLNFDETVLSEMDSIIKTVKVIE